ncbi:hypothetical protein BH10PSE4_BH10PSE4_42300 [soil metagenome]
MPRCKFAAWLSRPSSRVAIVGASGWIGMALVDRVLGLAPQIAPERLRLLGSSRKALNVQNRALDIEALDDAPPLGDGDWLVLHAAIVGADRVDGGDLDTVRQRNDAMLRRVLTLAETGPTRRLVFFSSGAAGRPEGGGLAKRAYARMKREHEAQVTDWSARTGRPALLPRVFNLGGPYINHAEAYALGDFILQGARDEGRIGIGSGARVSRSFVHGAEMAGGVLEMAIDPDESGAPFDVCLGRIVELDDLARAVARALDRPALIARPPPTGDSDDYVGDGARFQAASRDLHGPPISLDDIVADTVAYLRATAAIPKAGA